MNRVEFLESESMKTLLDKEICATSMIGSPDIERIKHVLYTFNVMKYLTKPLKKVKVTYEMNTPYKGMGAVCVIAKKLSFSDHELFMEVKNLSDNFEVYPKTNGDVQLNFTFYGMVKKDK